MGLRLVGAAVPAEAELRRLNRDAPRCPSMRRLGMFGLGSLDVGIELRGLAPVDPWKNPRSSLGGLTCHQLVSMRSVFPCHFDLGRSKRQFRRQDSRKDAMRFAGPPG